MSTTWTCPNDTTHPTAAHPILGWPQCLGCGTRPSIDERQAMVADVRVAVYAPKPGTPEAEAITNSAAVVGLDNPADHTTVYFEVNPTASDPIQAWRDGLLTAAQKLTTAQSTTSLMRAKTDNLARVGSYQVSNGKLTLEDAGILNAWLTTT